MSSGGKGGGKVKMPINPYQAAELQGLWGEHSAVTDQLLDMTNQNTPWGSLTYSPQAGSPTDMSGRALQYNANITLSPEQQALYNQQTQTQLGLGNTAYNLLGQVSGNIGQGLDLSQFGDVPGMGEYGRTALEDALFARLEPEIAQDRTRLDANLANKGISMGSQAYSGAYDDFNRGVNDQRLAVATQASSEQARQLQARQQAISEMLMQRSVPFNELMAMLGGSQAQMPNQSFVNTPTAGMAPFDATSGFGQQAQLDMMSQQAQQQQYSDMLGGLFGLGGALGGASILAFSDRRLKRDVMRIGTGWRGLPVYLFRYITAGGWQVGHMADEVKRVAPWAVFDVGGYDAVAYGALHG